MIFLTKMNVLNDPSWNLKHKFRDILQNNWPVLFKKKHLGPTSQKSRNCSTFKEIRDMTQQNSTHNPGLNLFDTKEIICRVGKICIEPGDICK